MVLHDDIDKVIDGDWPTLAQMFSIGCWPAHTVLVTNEHFTIQDLVIAEDVVQHLFVESVLRRSLESNLHATSLLGLQVDVPFLFQHVATNIVNTVSYLRGFFVQSDADSFQFSL